MIKVSMAVIKKVSSKNYQNLRKHVKDFVSKKEIQSTKPFQLDNASDRLIICAPGSQEKIVQAYRELKPRRQK